MSGPPDAARRIVLSGCSGGGKSTLLGELARRGWATVPEPGRRVIAAARAGAGGALPWVDMAAFARAALALAAADLAAAAGRAGTTVFDRGAVDAAVALADAGGGDAAALLAGLPRYDDPVFLLPPWPAIYVRDADRPHDLAFAAAEYARLSTAYPALGYRVCEVPCGPVAARADFVAAALA